MLPSRSHLKIQRIIRKYLREDYSKQRRLCKAPKAKVVGIFTKLKKDLRDLKVRGIKSDEHRAVHFKWVNSWYVNSISEKPL